MKLRYFHLRGAPPIYGVTIPFPRKPVLQRALSIRFVVGVNGSGKTRLMQAFTEILLSLAGKHSHLPYPFTLAYDIGTPNSRTVFIHNPAGEGSEPLLIEFNETLPENIPWAMLEATDWQAVADELVWGDDENRAAIRNRYLSDVPLSVPVDEYLPAPILVYTSGQTAAWKQLFNAPYIESGLDPAQQELGDENIEERPPNWNRRREQDYRARIGGPVPMAAAGLGGGYRTTQAGIFMDAFRLKLAACAVTLHLAYQDWGNTDADSANPPLRALLDEIDWGEPVALSLQFAVSPDEMRSGLVTQIRSLYSIAASALRPPEPGDGRRLVFDLRRLVDDAAQPDSISVEAHTTLEALLETLGGERPSPFAIFQTLHAWWERGLLADFDLVFRHRTAPDLMLYDWLSDGERMFLGRIALFYLLQSIDDALLILDEPETHFNDVWKRRLVDILDKALKGQNIEVLIASHSSIALTEVFAQEITLLRKEDGRTVLGRITTPTFGTDPSEIMINVFDAPDSIGERALEYLDTLLDKEDWTPDEIEELGQLIQHIGPGYYRSELRIKWRKLRATQS